jgi:hypothetical protein
MINVSPTCDLVLSNLFFYDFQSCYYTILENIGWSLEGIEKNDKTKRNIQLGILQKNNPQLSKFLIESSESLVEHYIKINNLKEKEVILKQRDGLISSRKLDNIDQTMPISLRSIILRMIITLNRNQYLAIHSTGEVEVKGISNKPEDVGFYQLFKNLDFTNKKQLFHGLEKIRQTVLNSKNIMWFTEEKEDMYLVRIIGEGIVKINRSSIKFIGTDDIDKNYTWINFIWPFAESCIIHFKE